MKIVRFELTIKDAYAKTIQQLKIDTEHNKNSLLYYSNSIESFEYSTEELKEIMKMLSPDKIKKAQEYKSGEALIFDGYYYRVRYETSNGEKEEFDSEGVTWIMDGEEKRDNLFTEDYTDELDDILQYTLNKFDL